MIRGVGRGFISGWVGVIMIGLALTVVTLCFCCWCYGAFYNRRRRGNSLDDPVSDLTLQQDSPKFLKLLAHRENERRLSQVMPLQSPGTPLAKYPSNIVEYSGAISPFPYMASSTTEGNNTLTPERNVNAPRTNFPYPTSHESKTIIPYYD